MVLKLLELVRVAWGAREVSIGIITPYKAQEALLRKMLAESKELRGMDVETRTVDGAPAAWTPTICTEWLGQTPPHV